MMKSYYICVVLIGIVALFSSVRGITNADCEVASFKDCSTCLNITGCAFCKANKTCFLYAPVIPLPGPPCRVADIQWETCIGTLKII